MHEGEEDHVHLEGDEGAVAFVGERVDLRSVGVDIGSSTSHLVFSHLQLERQGRRLSSRYAITAREVTHRSPVIFTPYAPSGQIDAAALEAFIAQAYAAAGISREDVDAGAVITTGEAARRENARAVAELFSREGGRFVCATAGPNLESLLAAHGSGAAELSLAGGAPLLNIDIGGGTTKFAVCRQGEVRQTAAVRLGARLLAWDDGGRLVRLEDAGRRVARAAGVTAPLALGGGVPEDARDTLAAHMAETILRIARGESPAETEGLWITDPLPPGEAHSRLVVSGGVGEYVYARESRDFGDLGPRLAAQLRERVQAQGLELLAPREAIRATCIGASQYTVQLSGDTIFLSDPSVLPVRSVPVAAVRGIGEPAADQVASAVRAAMTRLDLEPRADGRFALAVQWRHGGDYASLRELCAGIIAAVPPVTDGRPLLLVLDADVAGLVGTLLQQEFGVRGAIVCIDQVALAEFDFIDVGRPLPAQEVVPVVVKSLAFR